MKASESGDYKRFLEVITSIDEDIHLVLKSHLLIEEMLNRVISGFLYHPKYISNSSLKFIDKIRLARSMCLDKHDSDFWELIEMFNTLRNKLAHDLEREKRITVLRKLRDVYLRAVKDADFFARHKKVNDNLLVKYAATACLGFLSAFASDVEN